MSQQFLQACSRPFYSKAPFHHEPIPLLNGKEEGRTTIGIKTSIHINSLEATQPRNPSTYGPLVKDWCLFVQTKEPFFTHSLAHAMFPTPIGVPTLGFVWMNLVNQSK